MFIDVKYAFSDLNKAGRKLHTLHTPLVEGTTVTGEPCVNLCRSDSFAPGSSPQALVSCSPEGQWTPVRSLAEFQQQLTQTPAEQRGAQFGIWRDKRTWGGLKAPDGKPQDKEVETFASHWANQSRQKIEEFVDRRFRPGGEGVPTRHLTVGWSAEVHSVDPAAVQLLPACSPGKEVALLAEPLHVSQHQVVTVREYEHDLWALAPTATRTVVHRPGGSEVVASSKCPEYWNFGVAKTEVMPKF